MSAAQDDMHIHHPKLGQVPTGGDRFGTILKTAERLRVMQMERARQDYFAVRARAAAEFSEAEK